jgi:hypothetical protein
VIPHHTRHRPGSGFFSSGPRRVIRYRSGQGRGHSSTLWYYPISPLVQHVHLKRMWTRLALLAAAAFISLLPGCGDDDDWVADPNARKFSQAYVIHLDPDRTLEVRLTGLFTAREDKSEADAGRTDIYVKTRGEANITNVSEGRTTDGFNHPIELFVPIGQCPSWVKESDPPLGTHCAYDLFDIEFGELRAGESETVVIKTDERVDEVNVEDAATTLEGIRGPSAVLVAPEHLVRFGLDFFSTQYTHLDKFNPTCELPSGGRWVTYFSESAEVNACSTEG